MDRNLIIFSALVISFIILTCSSPGEIRVVRQVTGPIETNCYLVWDTKSKEAALIDPGGPVDSLLSILHREGLTLKYFLFTHGHFDHVLGLPLIRDHFPEALVCMHESDYADMLIQREWAQENFPREWLEEWEKDPAMSQIINFDASTFGKPDIFLTDCQILKLGDFELEVLHSPGHSPGSVCYSTGKLLFSGDVLFYRSVGRTDVMHSSREDLISSVQRLYSLLDDDTIVYPGHGDFTDIGSEKESNRYITSDEIKY